MSDLEFVTTDALVAELKKRTAAGICVYAYADESGEGVAGKFWGSTFWRAGVAASIAREHRAFADALLVPDDGEQND
jgi:hypothetical protein